MRQYLPLLLLLTISCNPQSGNKTIADHYCSSCHLPVSPSLLNKETWLKHVLPAMAPKLGIGVWEDDNYYVKPGSAITLKDWQAIVDYYKEMAPDSLKTNNTVLKEDDTLFNIHVPDWKDTTYRATTTMVAIDPNNGTLYSSSENGHAAALYQWDKNLHSTKYIDLQSTAVDMSWAGKDIATLTCIGNLRAVDQLNGVVWELGPDTMIKTIAMGLPRPVQTINADFNKDGKPDKVILGFGHKYGGLYLLKNRGEDYEKQVIRDVPGAIHAETGDFNNDGWPDLMVLFAYDDEGIWLFLNDQKGGFTTKNILRFPPVYGSTSFQLADVNKDNLPDIIYTAGDNGDYSMILKPYHGVYIYLNKGNFQFEQSWFYPINGCTKAIVADFDHDGLIDIATIAFFADLAHNPAEKFIFFKGKGSLDYQPHAVRGLAPLGRWICMAAGDYDQDGDTDLLLGSYSRGFIIQDGYKPAWDIYRPLVLLENHP